MIILPILTHHLYIFLFKVVGRNVLFEQSCLEYWLMSKFQFFSRRQDKKSTFSQPFKDKCISEAVRIGSTV